nr:immunoglobulin light chain junction region [Macaca mulatta]MOY06228.1 immunoglobulin light chain junction region [Macaca mulatta]MOY06931.1 immunoglobulin light chain junction region [Macaca mulatta]MOY09087.1 immunoglobulin light chain junction region [Macaca mulatta]MOY09816.1 immunoglobulin light chain junction region [Macaca mulatta]
DYHCGAEFGTGSSFVYVF